MATHHPLNERMKHAYFGRLRDALGMSEATIDHVAKAISRFEAYTRHRDFKAFHRDQARGFKQHLTAERRNRFGKPLSAATIYSTLNALKTFFVWLADQPGYKSRIRYDDIEYFSINRKDARVAKTVREPRVPTLEQIRHVLSAMPAENELEMRDRATIAFAILTGARDGAIASLRLKHVDLDQDLVDQDAREVSTKASKSITTYFFPVGDDIRQIFVDWIHFLQKQKLFGFDDPIFPANLVQLDSGGKFRSVGIDRRPWSNADRIREVFKGAFQRAGLPYYNPHSFRKTLVRLGQSLCQDIESMKAWSQNLGHEDLSTTFVAYGTLDRYRQKQLIAGMRSTEVN